MPPQHARVRTPGRVSSPVPAPSLSSTKNPAQKVPQKKKKVSDRRLCEGENKEKKMYSCAFAACGK
jgi:hypothetical protein